MLLPKKTKYRKYQRGRRRGFAKGQTTVQAGDYGLKALEAGWVTNRQIEAARIAMTRKIRRGGKVWINVFPDKPVTQKPAETRMGSGKGAPEHWVAVVKPAEEPVAEEPATEEPAADGPAAEEEPATEEPAAEEPAAEEPAAEEPAAEAEPAPTPAQPARKPKRKRLPRSERHKHSKPAR